MKPKYTRGPWLVMPPTPGTNEGFTVVAAPKVGAFMPTIAEVLSFGVTREVAEADARLIAEAPTLLEQSKAVLEFLETFLGKQCWTEINGQAHDLEPVECIEKLIAAIKRAEGEE
jgi:hypothetical protein